MTASAVASPASVDGLALFRGVCVDRSLKADQARGTPISFAAMPAAARRALARLNNAHETLDIDGGKLRAITLPGSETYLIVPAADADPNALPQPGCMVLWKAENLAEARSYRPPYEAHVAWQSTERDGWIVMRAIPQAGNAPAPLPFQAATRPTDTDVAVFDDESVIAAFKRVCWSGFDVEKVSVDALKEGWTSVAPGTRPVADAMRKASEAMAKPDFRVSVRQFQRKVGDRLLLLTIQRGELTQPAAESFGSTHCIIRELSDPQPLDIMTVQKAMGRSPSEITQGQDGSLFFEWHGLDLGAPTGVTIAYIPPKSNYVAPEFSPGIYLETEAQGPWGARPKQ